ncbi:MAG: hypothetical protein QF847_07300 [Candidatus Marinimicrobia bacterium]|jgi:hypothetical protein|nr:hypothetical protein [Candidatus Neomarinimicrobiota bacterium]MDP6499689.1 hypothetical protein [Candidatus Neomarinimicrobiota bacterium]MDP6727038.1 hypothetical protein [Candidatus Neomarinimicrobiota bacterium]|tara:strand:- start:7802 stop:7990 length:189 start_codon:yes stop_codon:yes gene_type:complete
MSQKINLSEIGQEIKDLKKTAELLKEKTELFPALQKNTARILASIKMLEINVSDILDLEIKK